MKRDEFDDFLYKVISERYNINEDNICYGEFPRDRKKISFGVKKHVEINNQCLLTVSISKKKEDLNEYKDFAVFNPSEEVVWEQNKPKENEFTTEINSFVLRESDDKQFLEWKIIEDFDIFHQLSLVVANEYDKRVKHVKIAKQPNKIGDLAVSIQRMSMENLFDIDKFKLKVSVKEILEDETMTENVAYVTLVHNKKIKTNFNSIQKNDIFEEGKTQSF